MDTFAKVKFIFKTGDTFRVVFIKRLFTKTLKWSIALAFLCLLLFAILWGVLKISSVQTWIINGTSSFFSESLGAKVSVGKINVTLFRGIVFEDVHIRSLHDENILSVKTMGASLRKILFAKKSIKLGTIRLSGAHLWVDVDSSGVVNFAKIFNFNNKDTSRTTWKFNIKGLVLENSILEFKNQPAESTPRMFDYNNIRCDSLNLIISNIEFSGGNCGFTVEKLSFAERCGFVLNNLKGQFSIGSRGCAINDLKVNTARSSLNVSFLYSTSHHSDSTFDIYHDLVFNTKINYSRISFSDVSFFSPQLQGLTQSIIVGGIFKGSINDFKISDFELSTWGTSYVKGDVDITGLPDIANTYFHVKITRLRTSAGDIGKIPLPPFGSGRTVATPRELLALGSISYRGTFTGYINELVSYGTLTTDLGIIQSDIKVKKDSLARVTISGRVSSHGFFAGGMTGLYPAIGMIDLDTRVDCIFDSTGFISAKVNGVVPRVELNRYSCTNVALSGTVARSYFDGSISINDPSIGLIFNGKSDFTGSLPTLDFRANIKSLNLARFNIPAGDSLAFLTLGINARVRGNSIDNIEGQVGIDSIIFENSQGQALVNNLDIDLQGTPSNRSITIMSDILDARLTGSFKLASIGQSFICALGTYLPSVVDKSDCISTQYSDSVNITLDLKNIAPLALFLHSKIKLDEGAKIAASIDGARNTFQVVAQVPSTKIGGITISNFLSETRTEHNTITMKTTFSLPVFNVAFDSVEIKGTASNDSASITCSWLNHDSLLYSGNIGFNTSFSRTTNHALTTLIRMVPSEIMIADSLWSIDSSSLILSDSRLQVNNFVVHDKCQELKVSGCISPRNSDSLSIEFLDFDLKYFNKFVKAFDLGLGGSISGKFMVFNILSNTHFHSHAQVSNMQFGGYNAGDLFIFSNSDPSNQNISLDIFTIKHGSKQLNIHGSYFPDDEFLDVEAQLDKLNLSLLNLIFTGVFSDIAGDTDGKIRLWGKLSSLQLQGYLDSKMSTFKIDYLNTRYWFSGRTLVQNNKLIFDHINGFDIDKNSGVVNGEVVFSSIYDIHYNVIVNAKNLLVLDTKQSDNPYFYGKAYASGVVKVSGDLTKTNIDASARSMPNTLINIPIKDDVTLGESSFFSFKNKNKKVIQHATPPVPKSRFKGVIINFDLDMTNDADIQMILDEKVGDIIRCRGNGPILLTYDLKENFNMYGTYEIVSGDYLFTMRNMINKKFEIVSGSKLSWNGQMFGATCDITARYKLKTTLAPLMSLVKDSNAIYKRRVPVSCLINLRNKIMNPTIAFDVDLSEGNEKAIEVFNNLSEDEKNKQFIALLVINGFNFDNSNQDQAFVLNSTEVVTNQLSNWLSKINKNVDVGVSYRPATSNANSQVELAMSTEILRNRVVLNVNGYTGIGNNTTAQNDNGIMGDVSVEVKLNKKGTLRAKGFNRTNNDNITEKKSDTQGIGIFFSQSFDKLADLVRGTRRKKKTQENKNHEPPPSDSAPLQVPTPARDKQ